MSPLVILLSRRGYVHHFGIKISIIVRCYCYDLGQSERNIFDFPSVTCIWSATVNIIFHFYRCWASIQSPATSGNPIGGPHRALRRTRDLNLFSLPGARHNKNKNGTINPDMGPLRRHVHLCVSFSIFQVLYMQNTNLSKIHCYNCLQRASKKKKSL